MWVEKLGATVIRPNVRGSSGYGKTFVQLDNGMLREDSVKDIGALLDWVGTQPDMDASRVAEATAATWCLPQRSTTAIDW